MALVQKVIFILFVTFTLASCERCVRHHVFGNDTYNHCPTGCCYEYIYPCCDNFYLSTPVIASMAASMVVILCGLVIVIVYYRHRQTVQRRLLTQMVNQPPIYSSVNPYNPALGSGIYATAYPASPPAYVVDPPPYSGDREDRGVDNPAVKY